MATSAVKSAERVLAVLEFLSEQPGPVLASSISRTVGIPKSSLYHILSVMRDHNFVTHYEEDRAWSLGWRGFDIGAYGDGFNLHATIQRRARPILTKLAERTNELAVIAVRFGLEALVGDIAMPQRHVAPGLPAVRTRFPAHLGAYGIALLSLDEDDQIRSLFPTRNPLPTITGRGATGQGALLQAIDRTRARGYAIDQGELCVGATSLAAVVFNHLGFAAAAMGITYWSAARSDEDLAALSQAVRASAAQLSGRLGFSEPSTVHRLEAAEAAS